MVDKHQLAISLKDQVWAGLRDRLPDIERICDLCKAGNLDMATDDDQKVVLTVLLAMKGELYLADYEVNHATPETPETDPKTS